MLYALTSDGVKVLLFLQGKRGKIFPLIRHEDVGNGHYMMQRIN